MVSRKTASGLNQFYSRETSPGLILVLLHIMNMFGPHIGLLPDLWNITVKHIKLSVTRRFACYKTDHDVENLPY